MCYKSMVVEAAFVNIFPIISSYLPLPLIYPGLPYITETEASYTVSRTSNFPQVT